MSAEQPIDKELINHLAEKAVAIPKGLGKRDERIIRKQLGKTQSVNPFAEVRVLSPLDTVLDEDDLTICRQELKDYEIAQSSNKLSVERYRLFRAVGIPDASIRTYLANLADFKIDEGMTITLMMLADSRLVQKFKGLLVALNKRNKQLIKNNNSTVLIDEESNEILKNLLDIEGVSVEEVYREIIRSRAESVELLKMQIEWLEKNLQDDTNSDSPETKQPIEDLSTVDDQDQGRSPLFPLSDWELFWTKAHWSADNNHLIPIPTISREDALDHIANITRGTISIKPSSVLKALEFHLQRMSYKKHYLQEINMGPKELKTG